MISKDGYNIPSKDERRICLVVVDMQRCFFAGRHDAEFVSAAERMRESVESFRESGRDVFFIGHIKNDGKEHDLNLIDVFEGCDIDVWKHHMDAFYNTDLSDRIHSAGYDSVLICGAYAEHCVTATYWGAYNHDLTPFLLEGGTVPFRKEKLASVETVCAIYSMDEMRENLAKVRVDDGYGTIQSRMKRKYWYVN